MNGIVHDDLAVGTDGSQLFDAAAEAGADTGGHNHQCSFHSFPPKLNTLRWGVVLP